MFWVLKHWAYSSVLTQLIWLKQSAVQLDLLEIAAKIECTVESIYNVLLKQ